MNDYYNLFIDQAWVVPDKVHPSSIGAGFIAQRAYECVKQNELKGFDLLKNIQIQGIDFNYYGYRGVDFKLNGWSCKIVQPKKTAAGKPWIWRARFWGHGPQTEIALLERGFHLVYCDVSGFLGAPEGIKRWNTFYLLMQKGGLSKKVVLEGMSRGGLYVYNWAYANPKKVACIYADNPVLDIKSWPGGKGKGPGSKDDWSQCLKAYHFKSDMEAINFRGNPVDHAKQIGRAGFPMLHVCGDDDEVVPMEENTIPFEKAIKSNGGNIMVIHKPGFKHHPHSLPNPAPIVDFILRATGNKINFAAIPAPGNEYRPGAGWKEGADWWSVEHEIDSICSLGKLDLLLIGNSITQGLGGNRQLVTFKPGQIAMNEVFKDIKWENAGISGDRTQHILWRLKNSNLYKSEPKYILFTIGVNNFPDNSRDEILEGIKACIKAIRNKMPNTKVMLAGPLPAGINPDHKYRLKYNEVQKTLTSWKLDKNIHYVTVGNSFYDKEGNLDLKYYANDGIHLTTEGYKMWVQIIFRWMKEID